MADDLAFETALGLGRRLARRELNATELTAIFLGRIDRYDTRAKAFIEVVADSARAAAEGMSHMDLGHAGPLAGLPYGLKDLIDVAGVRTTAGSRVLHDNTAGSSAFCVEQLQRAGAIFLGKTNLHEFAYGATGVNDVYGTALNAYDETRLACGSSSGSAAAVAFGLCPFALGTDTGGSVRAPALLNGLVGLKPTLGRISTRGVLPYSWSLDHVGIIARDVSDSAAVLAATAAPDALDPEGAAPAPSDYAGALERDIAGLRVGVPESFYFERVDPEVLAACEAVLRHLEAAGAKLVRVMLPSMQHARTVSLTVQMPEALSYHSRYLGDRGALYSPDFRAGLALGQCLLAEHYVRAKRFMSLYRQQTDRVFEAVDVLLTPGTPIVAPKLGTTKLTIDGVEEAVGNAVTRFTTFFNLTGHPAMTLPTGLHSSGLPLGVQLVTRHWEEETLFAAARAIERHDAFRIPPPDVH